MATFYQPDHQWSMANGSRTSPADAQPGWGQGKTDPSLLMFPEEFEKLEPGLNAFMRGAFQENPYQETPILSGNLFQQRTPGGDAIFPFSQCNGIDR
jgi:hypothetical protein